MFIGLASFCMKGKLQASLLAATFLVLALIFPLSAWLSSAFIALVFLRKGLATGLQVVLIAGIGACILSWFALGTPQVVILPIVLFWIPVIIVSDVLHRTVTIAHGLLSAGIIGFIVVLGIFSWYNGDPSVIWIQIFDEMKLGAELPGQISIKPADADEFLAMMAKLMTVTFAGMIVISAIISLLLARFWQATLYNPGGFGNEFRALKFGQAPAIAAIIIGILTMLVPSDLLLALSIIVLFTFMFQGLSIFHYLLLQRSMSKGWLYGLYILMLILLPQMALLLSTIGVSDAWLDWREKIAGKTKQ